MRILPLPVPIVSKDQPVALDVELFGAEESKLHRPTGKFASLSISLDGKNAYLVEKESDIAPTLKRLAKGSWTFHNAAFDITQLRRWAKIPDSLWWDTMLVERAMYSGYYNTFALDDLARRWLNIKLLKTTRKSFIKAKELDDEQRRYSALDAVITWQIRAKQEQEFTGPEWEVYKKIDIPAMQTLMRFEGMYIDQEAWLKLAKENRRAADKISQSLSFNPASPKQTLEALRKAGCKRLASTDAKDLKDHADIPLVQRVIEFRNYAKMAGTYGENFLEMVEGDGRIHAAFRVCGAETGRLSSSNPNFQNIPARKGVDFRSCFIAPRGRRLIIADYSQQEPRINAYLAKDTKMIALFKAGGDIYINVAKEVFGETITRSDPRRKKLKSVILGLSYGLSYKGLAVNEGISEEEAQMLIQRYLATFPAQREHVERTRNAGNEFVRTVAGRKMYINHYSYQWQNNVLNAPVQGGAADCSKIALTEIEKAIQRGRYDARIVNFVHDEIVVEAATKDSKAVAKIVHGCMVTAAETMFAGVPFDAEVYIGDRWSCKDKHENQVRCK